MPAYHGDLATSPGGDPTSSTPTVDSTWPATKGQVDQSAGVSCWRLCAVGWMLTVGPEGDLAEFSTPTRARGSSLRGIRGGNAEDRPEHLFYYIPQVGSSGSSSQKKAGRYKQIFRQHPFRTRYREPSGRVGRLLGDLWGALHRIPGTEWPSVYDTFGMFGSGPAPLSGPLVTDQPFALASDGNGNVDRVTMRDCENKF